MKKIVKNFIKSIIGQQFLPLCREYSSIPALIFQEIRRILSLIRYKRCYANDPEVLLSKLRTCAHIVDKGLQTANWGKGHSQAPYVQLCRGIKTLQDSSFNTDPSYQWAIQKKDEYEHAQTFGTPNLHSIKSEHPTFSKDDILHLIRSRRSTRTFEDRPIDAETLKNLADIISWSPTSCNRQPSKLFITQNQKKVGECLRQCSGATYLGNVIPCFIAVCADTRFYKIKDRNLPFIDVSLGLQNMLLMAHVQGIEGTILNWLHHTPKENAVLREVLEIPEYYSIIVNLIIGYGLKSAPTPGRKSNNLGYQIVN